MKRPKDNKRSSLFNVQKDQDLEAIFSALNVTQIWTETLVSETSEIVSAATGFSPLHATQTQTISYPNPADLGENSVLTLKRLGPNVFAYVAIPKIDYMAAICAENLSFPKGAQDIIELIDFGSKHSLVQNIEFSLESLSYVKKQIASLVISTRKLHSLTAPSHIINLGLSIEEKFLRLKRSWKSVVLGLERVSRPNQLITLGRCHDLAVREFEVLLKKLLEPLVTPQTLIPLEIFDTNGLGPSKISLPQIFVSNDGSIIIQFSDQLNFGQSTVSISTTIMPSTPISTWATITDRGGGFDFNKLWGLKTNFELPKTVPNSFLKNWWISGQPWSISLIDLILSTLLTFLWILYISDSTIRLIRYCKKRKARQNRLLKVNKLQISKTLPSVNKSNVQKNPILNSENRSNSPPLLDPLKLSPIRPSEVISRIRKIRGRANLDKTTRPIIEETIITRVCRNCCDPHPLNVSRPKSHKLTRVEVYPELVTEPVTNKKKEATIPLYRADSLLSMN